MSGRDGWELCGFCGEPLGAEGDSGAVANMPSHEDCAIRAIVGGLNHLRGTCTCCGGTEPPDPPGLTRREAARLAVRYWRARDAALRRVAKAVCHEFGLAWTDPATGERHEPPAGA